MAKILALLLFSMPLSASVTLTISTANISSTPQNGSYVRADLQNCANPTILNSSAVVTTPQRFYLPANSTQVTATLQDNVTQIACSGNQLSYWTFTYVYGMTQTQIKSVELPPGTFNLSNLANLTVAPWNPGVIQGPQGPQGEQGSGPPYFGLWASSQTYALGDTASYNNHTYISLIDNNLANQPNTSPSQWSVYVDPSGVSLNPPASQTGFQMSATYLNWNNILLYSSPLYFGASADTPDAMLTRTGAAAFSADSTTPGDGQASFKAKTINALTGYKLNGSAPSGHILIGDGTNYVDGVIPNSTLYYQTTQAAGVSQPQEGKVNFLSPLSASDNSGNGSTDVGLQPSGVTAGTYTNPNLTIGADGRVVSASNGSTSRTCNANGCYIVYPDGTIEQWGNAAGCGSGSHNCNVAVTFPTTFTTTTNLALNVTEIGGGANNFAASASTPSTSGFNIQYAALVFVGGSGGNLSGTQTASWHAIGN